MTARRDALRRARPVRRLAWWFLGQAPTGWAQRLRSVPVLGWVVHRLSHRLWPRGSRTTLRVQSGLCAGLQFELDPRFETKVWRGALEPELQERLRRLVVPGWTVWDVGASIGFFTLGLARLVGPDGLVVAFEPDTGVARRLRRHLAMNSLDNVQVQEVAAWSRAGRLVFGIRPDDRGRVHARVGDGSGEVECVALDDVLPGGPAPQLVKIDVEGAEVEVLRGAGELLGAHGPVVVCEVHLERGRAAWRLAEVLELLAGHGYETETLDPGADPVHLLACRPVSA